MGYLNGKITDGRTGPIFRILNPGGSTGIWKISSTSISMIYLPIQREIRRIAGFLDIQVTDLRIASIGEAVSFTKMKHKGEMYAPNGGKFLKNGANSFFHRGTNGHWKGVLSDSDLSKYELLARSLLSGDCRRWLEYGDAAT